MKDKAVFWFCMFAASAATAWFIASVWHAPFVPAFLVCVVVFGALGGLVSRGLQRPTRADAMTADVESSLRRMPLEVARRRALTLVSDPERFVVEKGLGPVPDVVKPMPDTVKDFFREIASVSMRYGDMKLERNSIRRLEGAPGLLAIGTGAADSLVVARASSGEVFETDLNDDGAEHAMPSIYHWLLLEAFHVYEVIPDRE